jgi:hypothetical protein
MIALTKPDKAKMVENMLIQMARSGQIQNKVSTKLRSTKKKWIRKAEKPKKTSHFAMFEHCDNIHLVTTGVRFTCTLLSSMILSE